MKEKGFTLIELLAVIVILAIIALIATPIILGIINNAKKESQERSAELYLNGVELAIARRNLTEEFNPGTCEIQTNGNLMCDGTELIVEVDGEVPTGGEILFDKNKVKEGTLNFGEEYTATIDENGKIVIDSATTEEETGGEQGGSEGNTTIVCRPATTKQKAYQYDNENNPSSASSYVLSEVGLLTSEVENKYSYGVTYMCDPGDGVERAFFLLEDGDTTALTKSDFSTTHYHTENYGTAGAGEVSLIMIENIGTSAWCEESSLTCNGYTAVASLQSLTSTWTVDVNLPTYAQIKQANGNSESNLAPWITSNLIMNSYELYYWLGTTGQYEYDGVLSCYVMIASGGSGSLDFAPMAGSSLGIRPVITVPKTQIG